MTADPLTIPAETEPSPTRSRGRAILSLVPPPVRARRAPFVALVLVLLAGGLVGLLLLNTASAQDAFRLHTLQSEQASLEQQREALAQSADGLSDPARLAARARALGLVAGGTPIFLAPGQPIPKGAIRIGDLVYVPGVVPVPTPAPATTGPAKKPAAKKTVKKPTAKRPVATKPTAKKPIAKAPVVKKTTPTATKPAVKKPVAVVPPAGTTRQAPVTRTYGAPKAATPTATVPRRTPVAPATQPSTGLHG